MICLRFVLLIFKVKQLGSDRIAAENLSTEIYFFAYGLFNHLARSKFYLN